MANLIITESILIAIHIAAALGGIKTKKGQISYDDIPNQTARLNDMAQNKKKFFKTTYKGKPCYVTWISQSPIKEMDLKEQPKLFHYKSYNIQKQDLERLTYNEYKKDKTDNVYFVLSDTEKSNIAKSLIKKTIKANDYFNVRLHGIGKEEITNAFSIASRISKETQIQESLQRDIHRTNARNEISARLNNLTLDQYELAALSIIKKKESLSKAEKKIFHIHGKAQIHGIPCSVIGRKEHTKEEAESIIKDFPQSIILDKEFESGYKPGFLTTPNLFSFNGIKDLPKIRTLAFSLYERGLITSPYSLCSYIPATYKRADENDILQSCIDWTKEETIKRSLALSAIQAAKKRDLSQIGITPHTIEGKEHLITTLSDEAKDLYSSIIDQTETAIKENTIESFRFLAGDYPLYTIVNIEEIKSTLKVNEQIGASFSVEEDKNGYHFITPRIDDVFKEMQALGIGTADIFFDIYEGLIDKELISLNEKGAVTLTEKGKEAFTNCPAGKDFLLLCAKWDQEVKKETFAEWPIRAIEELKDQLDKDFSILNKGKPPKVRDLPKEEKKTPEEEPAITKTEIKCPNCNSLLSEDKGFFLCEECSFSIAKDFEKEGYKTRVTKEDVISLSQRGRTTGKVFEGNGEFLTAYIVIKEGLIDITNETLYKCPKCGENFYIYDWGFGCSHCDYMVPFYIKNEKLSASDLKELLLGKETGYIEAFNGRLKIVNGAPALVKESPPS